jgi:hypothetical protein
VSLGTAREHFLGYGKFTNNKTCAANTAAGDIFVRNAQKSFEYGIPLTLPIHYYCGHERMTEKVKARWGRCADVLDAATITIEPLFYYSNEQIMRPLFSFSVGALVGAIITSGFQLLSIASSTTSNLTPIVKETANRSMTTTTLPVHVVNSNVVNMNGRQHLGQGEKILVVGLPKAGTSSITHFFDDSKKYKTCHHLFCWQMHGKGKGK